MTRVSSSNGKKRNYESVTAEGQSGIHKTRGVAVECHAPCLNRCFIPQSREEITGTFAVRALFIAVISGCLAVCTFAPIRCFDSSCVNATAALFAAGFGAASVCHPNIVTGAATLGTTRNRQISLHSLMVRLSWCVHLFHTRLVRSRRHARGAPSEYDARRDLTHP